MPHMKLPDWLLRTVAKALFPSCSPRKQVASEATKTLDYTFVSREPPAGLASYVDGKHIARENRTARGTKTVRVYVCSLAKPVRCGTAAARSAPQAATPYAPLEPHHSTPRATPQQRQISCDTTSTRPPTESQHWCQTFTSST